MSEKFYDWLHGEELTTNNPFREGDPGYWAWEGWMACVKANRIEAPEPELLKALKALVLSAERVSVGEYNEETLDINLSQARAAIVKATGEKT